MRNKGDKMKLVESLQGQTVQFGIDLISVRELLCILKVEGGMQK